MSAKASSELPIAEADLKKFFKTASTLLMAVSHAPKKDLASLRASAAIEKQQSGLSFSSMQSGDARPQTMAIFKIAKEVNQGDELFDENISAALNAVRTGLQIGFHIASLYGKTSTLDRLNERKQKNELKLDAELMEWKAKMEAQAAITLFVTASYVAWKLNGFKAEELSRVNVSFDGLPEMILTGRQQAAQATLYHYGSYVSGAQSGLEFLKYTQSYFQAVVDDLKMQAKNLESHTQEFTDKNYRLEGTQFTVNGFQTEFIGGGASVEFKRVDIKDIVGNKEAKHHAYRMAQYLIAYDFERKLNPFAELGAFPWIYLMKGKPGTGKTMAIGATLTLTSDFCKALDIPFRAHPFPNTIVSTFQGGSAENMQNWMNALKNPNELIIAPIDDAETAFESRTRQGVSSGVREVINTFLVNTEGAMAVVRGNAMIQIATNIPDQIDLAVLSRVQGRTSVDGAETKEDWMDQIRLWTDKIDGWGSRIVDLQWPTNYAFLSAQGISIQKKEGETPVFKDGRLVELHERLTRSGLKTHGFEYFGSLYGEVTKIFPQFSSRDERNIRTAVMTRFFDFDLPVEWLEKRTLFVEKDFDTKRTMILDHARQNMGKLKFSDVMFEEAVRYLNATVSILDGGKQRRIEERAEQIEVDRAALRLLESKA